MLDERARMSFTIGRFWARPFRRGLRDWGLTFSEDKGWLDSHFVVTAEPSRLEAFHREFSKWVQRTQQDGG